MRLLSKFIPLRRFSTKSIQPKVCIVGSGPAGFYSAQHIQKNLSNIQIDILERLPVPFGLVRFGVAPDHPEVKNVINTFTKTAESPNVRYIGNVNLGSDITLQDLKQSYHIVLLTYGAEENRKLNVPGEDKSNVIYARRIVGWYNGIPWDSDLNIDLTGETVAIFGQGNVAVDVARILLSPIDELKKTDITEHALAQLSRSKIKSVQLIGRRGPLQAAFTIKELREMLKLPNCSTLWNKDDFEGLSNVIPNLARPKKRITELMIKSSMEAPKPNMKLFKPVFKRSPLEIIGDSKVKQVRLGINNLSGDDILSQKASLTDQTEVIDCDLAIPSIGYTSKQADKDIPFDHNKGIIHNENGQVEPGVYSSGWLSTGPTGVILTTMSNAFSTADLIVNDLKRNEITENKPGFKGIENKLKEKNVQLVEWKDWLKIDKYEQEAGQKLGKPREKIVDISKMLEIAS